MISLNWVGDYVDIANEDISELTDKITKFGVNIEKVISNNINNLVIGLIKKVEKHPDSDHLNVCEVDLGSEVVQIVCGASNVRENLKVIVATPGAILPGNFEIKKSKIRGVESNGMICALFELGLEEKTEETYSKGITELDNDAPVGENPLKYLGLEDTILELDIHKHHNNDCYYHIGFAYIIAAILNKKVTLPKSEIKEINESINDYFKLKINTDKCTLYTARMVKDVKIGESPDFIKNRLAAAGMRSINNVVDISNYVMLEYGQPLHFFDKDKLGNEIVVRLANDKENLRTLDEKDRVLDKEDIVITDGKKPVCLAGVMGGENTEVDENTKNILIESAIFDGINIRRTSARHDLRSEASTRYGKGLNYEYTYAALDRAAYLLQEYASGKVLKDIVKVDNVDKTPKIIEVTSKEINDILGIEIKDDEMEKEFEKLGFENEYKDGKFIITIPPRRLDIETTANDIAEEIGCLYGYHNLVGTLPVQTQKKGEYKGSIGYRKQISKRLRALGLNEDKNYTLISPEMANMFIYEDKKQIILPNPMSMDKSVIRTTLLPSMLNTYEYNKKRHVKDINIYEISNTYYDDYKEDTKIAVLMSGNYISNSWNNDNIKVDFYTIKGVLENLFNYLGLNNRYSYERLEDNKFFHPGMSAKIFIDKEEVGVIGRVHPSILKDDVYVLELSMTKMNRPVKPLKFKEANKYPEITKDVAFIVDKKLSSRDVEKVIKKAGGRLLSDITVFDVYTGEKVGKDEKQIAYSLKFNASNRTLTEEEVMECFNNIIKKVTDTLSATLRDN